MDNIWIIYGSGWWFEKYEFLSWDDYSKLNGKIKNVPNHQPVYKWDEITLLN